MYQVKIEPAAIKDLKKMDRFEARKVTVYLQKLKHMDNPRSLGKPLIKMDPQNWRYRVGKIRILCEIDDPGKTIYVLAVAHRKHSY